jgi:hypothetical protein
MHLQTRLQVKPHKDHPNTVNASQSLCFPATSFFVTKLEYVAQERHFGPVCQPGLSPPETCTNLIAHYSIDDMFPCLGTC